MDAFTEVPNQLNNICVTALLNTDKNIVPIKKGKRVSGLKKILATSEKLGRNAVIPHCG
jgi:hypothetical protein